MKPTAVNGWLLDTHALLWMLHGDSRLSKRAIEHIDGNLPVFYSTISFWEIALKRCGSSFDFMLEDDWDIVIPRELEKLAVLRIDLDATDCHRMESLPLHHRDPFDRMLITQAMQRRFGILSRDTLFDDYDALRVW
jgi:PIN domain nuclease of toxin-antitoxin system